MQKEHFYKKNRNVIMFFRVFQKESSVFYQVQEVQGKAFMHYKRVFKSQLAHAAISILAGVDVSNKPSRVLYISLEDGKEEIKNRLSDIYSFYDDDKKEFLRDLSEFVDIYPISSENLPLISISNELTKAYSEIYSLAMSNEYRLIIIDTLRRSHDCDENNNGVMSQVLRSFEILAEKSKASVLLLHHENKFSFADNDSGSSSVRGASSIVDNARYVLRLQTMTTHEAKSRQLSDDDRRFWVGASLEKTNYGPPGFCKMDETLQRRCVN